MKKRIFAFCALVLSFSFVFGAVSCGKTKNPSEPPRQEENGGNEGGNEDESGTWTPPVTMD